MTGEGKSESTHKLAVYSGITALLAFIACNGLIVVTAALAMFGITFNINPHVQAILISVFAILTSVLVFKGYLQHRKTGPLLLAAAGALVIVLTLYISYSKLIESAGLFALVVAAGWNWQSVRQKSSGN
jgi:hypothetical protein